MRFAEYISVSLMYIFLDIYNNTSHRKRRYGSTSWTQSCCQQDVATMVSGEPTHLQQRKNLLWLIWSYKMLFYFLGNVLYINTEQDSEKKNRLLVKCKRLIKKKSLKKMRHFILKILLKIMQILYKKKCPGKIVIY